MLKRVKIYVLILISVLFACLFGAQAVKSKTSDVQAETSYFAMEEGTTYRSRWIESQCGLTYTARISKSKIEEFKVNNGTDNSSIKLFIIPYEYVTGLGGSTVDRFASAKELINSGKYVEGFKEAERQGAKFWYGIVENVGVVDNNSEYLLIGGLKGIQTSNMNRRYFGIYYIEGEKNGETIREYAEKPSRVGDSAEITHTVKAGRTSNSMAYVVTTIGTNGKDAWEIEHINTFIKRSVIDGVKKSISASEKEEIDEKGIESKEINEIVEVEMNDVTYGDDYFEYKIKGENLNKNGTSNFVEITSKLDFNVQWDFGSSGLSSKSVSSLKKGQKGIEITSAKDNATATVYIGTYSKSLTFNVDELEITEGVSAGISVSDYKVDRVSDINSLAVKATVQYGASGKRVSEKSYEFTPMIVGSGFGKWTATVTGSGNFSGTITTTFNITQNVYKITKGSIVNGDITISPTESPCDETITLTNTAKTGYKFVNYIVDGTEQTENAFIMPNKNIVVGANFTAENYKITYETNGGTFNGAKVESYDYGVGATLSTNVTKTGYTFEGWYTNSNLSGTAVTKIGTTETGDKTFYAKWTAKSDVSYTIRYYKVNTTTKLANDTNVTGRTFNASETINAKTIMGYTISGSNTQTITHDAYNKTYTFYYTANTYTITYNGNGNTGGSTANSTHTYDVAQKLTTNGFIKTGYTFAGWATSASGEKVYSDGQSVTNLASAQGETVTLYATWTVNTYNITYQNLNDGNYGANTPTKYTYGVGATLVNPTRTGYAFNGWFTSSSFSGNAVTKIGTTETGDKTFYAKWTANTYTVNFNLNGGADNSGTYTSSKTYTYDSVYNIASTIPTKSGYVFAGWTLTSGDYSTAKFGHSTDAVTGTIDNEYSRIYIVGERNTATDNLGHLIGGYYLNGKNIYVKNLVPSGSATLKANWTVGDVFFANTGGGLANGSMGISWAGTQGDDNSGCTSQIKAGIHGNFKLTFGYYQNACFNWWESDSKYGSNSWKTGMVCLYEYNNWFYGTAFRLDKHYFHMEDTNKVSHPIGTITVTMASDSEMFQGENFNLTSTKFVDFMKNSFVDVTVEGTDVGLSGGYVTITNVITSYTSKYKGQKATLAYKVVLDSTVEYIDVVMRAEGADISIESWNFNKVNKAYNVSYNLNGGTHGSGYPTTYKYGVGATLVNPTKTGYTFGGWYTNSSFSGSAVTVIGDEEIGDKTFYAKWTVNSYQVSFDYQGGSGIFSSATYNFGTTYDIGSTIPTRSGYKFAGWTVTGANVSTARYGRVAGTTNDTIEGAYSRIYNADGGSRSAGSDGTNLIGGYYLDGTGIFVRDMTPTNGASITFVAHWTLGDQFNAGTGGGLANGTRNLGWAELCTAQLKAGVSGNFTLKYGYYQNACFHWQTNGSEYGQNSWKTGLTTLYKFCDWGYGTVLRLDNYSFGMTHAIGTVTTTVASDSNLFKGENMSDTSTKFVEFMRASYVDVTVTGVNVGFRGGYVTVENKITSYTKTYENQTATLTYKVVLDYNVDKIDVVMRAEGADVSIESFSFTQTNITSSVATTDWGWASYLNNGTGFVGTKTYSGDFTVSATFNWSMYDLSADWGANCAKSILAIVFDSTNINNNLCQRQDWWGWQNNSFGYGGTTSTYYMDGDVSKFNGKHQITIQRSGNAVTITRIIYNNNVAIATITTTGTASGKVSVAFVGEKGTMTAVDVTQLYT